MRDRIRQPPSSLSGELGVYLREIANILNTTPTSSYFSGSNPNTSGVTGQAGHILVNVGSTSTSTRMWVMGTMQAGVSLSTNSWVPLRIA